MRLEEHYCGHTSEKPCVRLGSVWYRQEPGASGAPAHATAVAAVTNPIAAPAAIAPPGRQV
jgi:hypothetical protein